MIILVFGPSSAGKTTFCKSFQERVTCHFLRWSIDDIFKMVSPRWGGGANNKLNEVGFSYNKINLERTEISIGDVGLSVLHGFQQAVKGFAQADNNILVDHCLLYGQELNDWMNALGDHNPFLVNLKVDQEVGLQREVVRNQVRGLHIGTRDLNQVPSADLVLDTTNGIDIDSAFKTILESPKWAV